jgi:hypothetical protein
MSEQNTKSSTAVRYSEDNLPTAGNLVRLYEDYLPYAKKGAVGRVVKSSACGSIEVEFDIPANPNPLEMHDDQKDRTSWFVAAYRLEAYDPSEVAEPVYPFHMGQLVKVINDEMLPCLPCGTVGKVVRIYGTIADSSVDIDPRIPENPVPVYGDQPWAITTNCVEAFEEVTIEPASDSGEDLPPELALVEAINRLVEDRVAEAIGELNDGAVESLKAVKTELKELTEIVNSHDDKVSEFEHELEELDGKLVDMPNVDDVKEELHDDFNGGLEELREEINDVDTRVEEITDAMRNAAESLTNV